MVRATPLRPQHSLRPFGRTGRPVRTTSAGLPGDVADGPPCGSDSRSGGRSRTASTGFVLRRRRAGSSRWPHRCRIGSCRCRRLRERGPSSGRPSPGRRIGRSAGSSGCADRTPPWSTIDGVIGNSVSSSVTRADASSMSSSGSCARKDPMVSIRAVESMQRRGRRVGGAAESGVGEDAARVGVAGRRRVRCGGRPSCRA